MILKHPSIPPLISHSINTLSDFIMTVELFLILILIMLISHFGSQILTLFLHLLLHVVLIHVSFLGFPWLFHFFYLIWILFCFLLSFYFLSLVEGVGESHFSVWVRVNFFGVAVFFIIIIFCIF